MESFLDRKGSFFSLGLQSDAKPVCKESTELGNRGNHDTLARHGTELESGDIKEFCGAFQRFVT